MPTDHVATLPQARWLAAHGFPQDRFPQMVWVLPGEALDYWRVDYFSGKQAYLAAPPLAGDGPDTALGWLEQKYGWGWTRYYSGASRFGWFSPRGKYPIEASTASGLMDAVIAAVDGQEALDAD